MVGLDNWERFVVSGHLLKTSTPYNFDIPTVGSVVKDSRSDPFSANGITVKVGAGLGPSQTLACAPKLAASPSLMVPRSSRPLITRAWSELSRKSSL